MLTYSYQFILKYEPSLIETFKIFPFSNSREKEHQKQYEEIIRPPSSAAAHPLTEDDTLPNSQTQNV